MLLRNQLYAGIVNVPEYGVRGKRGDFEPLISEELFYRVSGTGDVGGLAGADKSRRFCRAVYQARRRACARIQTFLCAASSAASPADVA